jgi:hypothetical protein
MDKWSPSVISLPRLTTGIDISLSSLGLGGVEVEGPFLGRKFWMTSAPQ